MDKDYLINAIRIRTQRNKQTANVNIEEMVCLQLNLKHTMQKKMIYSPSS